MKECQRFYFKGVHYCILLGLAPAVINTNWLSTKRDTFYVLSVEAYSWCQRIFRLQWPLLWVSAKTAMNDVRLAVISTFAYLKQPLYFHLRIDDQDHVNWRSFEIGCHQKFRNGNNKSYILRSIRRFSSRGDYEELLQLSETPDSFCSLI